MDEMPTALDLLSGVGELLLRTNTCDDSAAFFSPGVRIVPMGAFLQQGCDVKIIPSFSQ